MGIAGIAQFSHPSSNRATVLLLSYILDFVCKEGFTTKTKL